MAKMMKKIKKVIDFIVSILKPIIIPIGLILAAIFAARKIIAFIGKVDKRKNWQIIPGVTDEVMVEDDSYNWKRVKLPYSEELGRQVVAKDIQAIGTAYTAWREINVEVIHKPTDRTGANGTSDMSIGK